MAVNYTLAKHFKNHTGLDLRSSDLNRVSGFASDLLNVQFRKTGAITKRQGYQSKATGSGGFGLGTYADISTEGLVTEKIVSVDANLQVLTPQTFTITYAGSGSARVQMFLDTATSTFKLVLLDDGVEVLNQDLGTGINEVTPYSVTSLKAAVDAVTDFSAAISDGGTEPAAYIQFTRDLDISTTAGVLDYFTWVEANKPLAKMFPTTEAEAQGSTFTNASMVNLGNILYIATGRDDLMKYDGQTCYRAGMPKPATAPTTALVGSGSITDTNVKYIYSYIQFDAKGNVIEGVESNPSANIAAITGEDVDVTVSNIEDTTGFNTNCGLVSSNQVGVTTILMDDGLGGDHTLKVGDTAYFLDRSTGDYVTREVTAITSGSIDIDGAAVDVNLDDPVSNNLRIALYRSTAGGNTFYLVAEVPNDSFNAGRVWRDTIVSGNLGAEYLPPIVPHELPPKAAYVSAFQNRLVLAGDEANVNTTYYSDIDSPEYFSTIDNSFVVDTTRGDKITGIGGNNRVFFIFKDQSIHIADGDFEFGNFSVREVIGGDVGCSSHHSIQEIKGKLMFLGKKGVFALDRSTAPPAEVSVAIEPLFTAHDVEYDFNKAIALNSVFTDEYILYMPVVETGTSLHATDESRLFIYDYFRGAWTTWDNMNAAAGMVLKDKTVWFMEKRLDTLGPAEQHNIYSISNTGDTYDYADHADPISFSYSTHWDNGGVRDEMGRFTSGDPTTPKKFLRLKVHALDDKANDFATGAFSIDTKTEIDYITDTSSEFTLAFTAGSNLGWGRDPWGEFPWGNSRLIAARTKLKSTKTRALRLIFENTALHENVLISGYELEIAAPYSIAMKD